jgi:branched-chain amino acid transport system ATP-binding protein
LPLLQVTDLEVRYGHIRGTNGITLSVAEGETLALVGSNGAGKSSTLKAILGMVVFPRGEIHFMGQPLAGRKPHQISRLGVGFSPEGRRVFPQLSVQENLKLGAYSRTSDEAARRMEEMYAYFPRLKERYAQAAGSLSGGEQQMLAIGRALMSYPKLFLLDEPSLGLAPIIVERIGEILQEVQTREKLSVILAEQNATWAMSIASRAVIIELGKVVAEGDARELMKSPKVRDAFLGVG